MVVIGSKKAVYVKTTYASNAQSRANRKRLTKLASKVTDLSIEVRAIAKDVKRIQLWMEALYDVKAHTGPGTRPRVTPVIVPGQDTL